MNKLTLTDKRNKTTTEFQAERLTMARPGVVILEASRAEIAGVERVGNSVLVRFRDGRRVAVDEFFRADGGGYIGDIVLREPDGSLVWWSNPLQDWGLARLEALPSIDPLLLTEPADAGMVVSAFAPGGGMLGALAGLGLLGAAAAGGGGSSSNANSGAGTLPPAGGGTGGGTGTGGGSTSGGTLPPAGGGTVVPPAGGSPLTVTVPAATNGLSQTEVAAGVMLNIGLPTGAAAGDRITVTIDGRPAASMTLTPAEVAAGSVNLTLPSSSVLTAGEGAATIIATATDPNGVARPGSPASVMVNVDTLAPVLANPNPSSYADNVGPVQSVASREPSTDDATPGLNIGTIPDDVTPKLFVNGLLTAATYNKTTGTLTPDSPLPNGTHDLTYSLTDVAGNESVRSGALRLTVAAGSTTIGLSIPENNNGGINAAEAADGVAVLVTLPAGLVAASRGTAAVDGPSVGILAASAPQAQAAMVLPLAAAAGDRISVSIDDGTPITVVLTAADVAAGRITVILPPGAVQAAGQGVGIVTGIYTTANGQSAEPVTAEVFIDTLAPALVNASPDTYADNVGPSQSANSRATVTDDTTPGLNIGPLPAGVDPRTGVILLVNGEAVPATYSEALGTLTPNSPLPNGTFDLSYAVRDAVGNQSTPSTPPLRLIVSNAAPGVLSVSVPENADGGISAAEAADGVLALIVLPTGAAAGDRVAVTIGGQAPVQATVSAADVAVGRLSVTIPPETVQAAGQGATTVGATYTNGAGLASGPVFVDVVIDTMAPGAISVSVPEDTGNGVNAAEAADGVAVLVALPANAAAGDRLTVSLDDGTPVVVTLTAAQASARQATVVLPPSAVTAAGQGPATVNTVLVDAAGNPGSNSPVNTAITIDTVAPTLGIANPNAYVDNAGSLRADPSTAAVSDDNTPGLIIGPVPSDAVATLFVNGTAVASVPGLSASGQPTLTPTAPLPDGIYDLSYTLRDAAGNESPRSGNLRLTVDTTPPATPGTAIAAYRDDIGATQSNNSSAAATDDSRPGFLIGALPPDASNARLFVDGALVSATYDPVTGSLTPTAPLLADGVAPRNFQIAYALVDAAGNQSGVSPNFSLTVDAQAPTLAISQSAAPNNSLLTFRFSEAVTGFVQGDVTITNGTLLNFTAVDDRTFTANFVQTGAAAPVVSVATGSYTDSVGNAGAAASLSTSVVSQPTQPTPPTPPQVDTTPPVLQSASSSSDGTRLVLVYNETLDAVNVPAPTAFTVLTGTPPVPNAVTAVAVQGNTVTLTLTTPIVAGAGVNLTYTDPTPANDALAVQDVAGNDAATQASVAVVNQVTQAPINATITVEPNVLAAGQTAAVTINFSSLPTGFTLADLNAEGGTVSALTTTPAPQLNGSFTYTATFTPAAGVNDPTNVITLAAGSYTDALGRPGGAATSNNFEVNTTNPLQPITALVTAISEDTLTGPNTSTSDFITNDRILTVSGSINRALAPGERVQVQVDGGMWMDATVDPVDTTVWFLGLTTSLTAGAHTLGARVVDSATAPVGTGPTSQNINIVANVAPVTATSTSGGLLGVVSLDALGGALNLSQQQALSAVDVDNNLQRVVISTGGVANLVNLGTITASQPLATELGLAAVPGTTGGLLGVGSTNNLTITALGGGELDNLRVSELLATVNLNGGAPVASLTALTAATVAATDANNLTTTTTGNVTAVSLSALSLVLPGAVILGTAGGETLTGDATANRLYGFAGNDTLVAAGGNDLLRGGAGVDVLQGGDGDDLLIYDASDATIDGGPGTDVLRVETGQLNLITGTVVRNIETVNLGKGDGRSTAVITGAGLLANGVQTILIEGDQEDGVTIQGGTLLGQVQVGRQAFREYQFAVNGQEFLVRVEDGVSTTVIGG